MKRQHILRFLAMASVVLFTSFSASAQEKSASGSVAVSVIQPDKAKLSFMVIVGNPEQKKVLIKLIKTQYGVIDRKVFKKVQYGMICNLNDADDGEYLIEVSSGNQVIKRSIVINTVSVFETNRQVSLASR